MSSWESYFAFATWFESIRAVRLNNDSMIQIFCRIDADQSRSILSVFPLKSLYVIHCSGYKISQVVKQAFTKLGINPKKMLIFGLTRQDVLNLEQQ